MSVVEEKINDDVSRKDSTFKRPSKAMDMDDMVFGKISGIVNKKVKIDNKKKAANRNHS